MKKDYLDILTRLTQTLDDSRLVIFVGAGISKNSSLPDWFELVKAMADKLNIPTNTNFTSEDLLKIPQLLFNRDQDQYWETLKENFQVPESFNELDDLIVKLYPHHIITTNYDHLLELASSSNNIQDYSLIYDDASFITKHNSNNQFLIKMHGDANYLKSIILKESDYLDYSNTHILISNFIKALLTTHTFLFVGYSLRDNNLKLILSWINYIQKQLTSNEKSLSNNRNVLLYSPNENSIYSDPLENSYYTSSNIDLVNLENLPEDILKYANTSSLQYPVAKKIYAFLSALYHREAYSLKSNLVYSQFENQDYIAFQDIINVISPKENPNYTSDSVTISEDLFMKFVSPSNSKAKSPIEDKLQNSYSLLSKTQLRYLAFIRDNQIGSIKISRTKTTDKVLKNIITNNYGVLRHMLESKNLSIRDTLYASYITQSGNVNKLLTNYNSNKIDDYFDYIINIVNTNFFNGNYKSSPFQNQTQIQDRMTKTLQQIYNRNSIDITINSKNIISLVTQQEGLYQGTTITFVNGIPAKYGNMDSIKYLTYDFYKYARKNHVFIDYAIGRTWNVLFSPLIQAELATYLPLIGHDRQGNLETNYRFNDFDVDIMTKLIHEEELAKLLSKFDVASLKFESTYRLMTHFTNLINSTSSKNLGYFDRFVVNYLHLLTYAKLDNNEVFTITKHIFEQLLPGRLTINIQKAIIIFFHAHMLNQTDYKLKKYFFTHLSSTNAKLPDFFKHICTPYASLSDDFRHAITQFFLHEHIGYTPILNKLSTTKDETYFFFFSGLIQNSNFSKSQVKRMLERLVITNPNRALLIFLEHDFPELRNFIFHLLIKVTDKERYDKNTYHYPDLQAERINCIVHLICAGFRFQKRYFHSIADLSPVLSFITKPEKFDYSSIDITQLDWQILINNQNYSLRVKKLINLLRQHRIEIAKANQSVLKKYPTVSDLLVRSIIILELFTPGN